MNKTKFMISMLILSLFISTISASEMSVDEAYRAIPHQRTVFDDSNAKMSDEALDFLIETFELVDLTIVERVTHVQWLRSRNSINTPTLDQYESTLDSLESMDVPDELQAFHTLLSNAIREQKDYLEKKLNEDEGNLKGLRSDPLVGRSHQKLIAAYTKLMKLYPNESQHNKKAFFDYLCALDFI